MGTKLLIIIFILSISSVFAQEKKTVAVLPIIDKKESVEYEHELLIRSTIVEAITNSDGYIAMDMNSVDEIIKTAKFHESGLVKDNERMELGKILGTKYMLKIEVADFGKELFLTVSLIEGETGILMQGGTANELVEKNPCLILEACLKLTNKLFAKESVLTNNKTISLPSISTNIVHYITDNSAVVTCSITDGEATVTERGVCYSKNNNPTISDIVMSSDSDQHEFSINLLNLEENTTYFVKAYAKNSAGTEYGEEQEFNTKKTILKPTVITGQISYIIDTSATVGGEVSRNGGDPVIERGIVYSTSQNPTTNNSKIIDGSGIGIYSINLTGLNDNTTYYVRAYATNSAGAAYGEELSFKTEEPDLSTFIDLRDNKKYKTVKIGNQVWMAENLNYTTPSGSWCYNNSPSNCNIYGRLYNWETAQTVCPSGWKLPSHNDFITLLSNVIDSEGNSYDALIANGSSGFNALFGGSCDSNGFSNIGDGDFWWSSSTIGNNNAWYMGIRNSNESAYLRSLNRDLGFSVRCIKDDPFKNEFETLYMLQLENKSINSYEVVINGVIIYLTGKYSMDCYLSLGVYNVTVTQLGGYLLYPTIESITIDLNSDKEYSFPNTW